nr:hypothetical protein [Clostridium saccharoperbutylacetonicum]
MHNSAAQSKSSSVPGLSALSEIGKIKDKLEKKAKAKFFLGIVEILAVIYSENEEKLNNVASLGASVSAKSTAIAINAAQDAIQAVRGGNASTGIDSYSPRVIDDGPSTPPLIPPAVDDGPSTPPLIPPAIDDGSSTPPLTPPVIDNGPSTPPLIPPAPDDGPSTPPLIPPAHKELEDMILRAKVVPKTGTWIPVGKTEEEWKTDHGYTLGPNTLNKKEGEHKKSFPLKDKNGNVIGRVDRGYRVNGNVVVDHVHLNTDVGNVHHWFNDKPKKNNKNKNNKNKK